MPPDFPVALVKGRSQYARLLWRMHNSCLEKEFAEGSTFKYCVPVVVGLFLGISWWTKTLTINFSGRVSKRGRIGGDI